MTCLLAAKGHRNGLKYIYFLANHCATALVCRVVHNNHIQMGIIEVSIC